MDTVITGYMEADTKLVVWSDSIGCSSCEINRMHKWADILNYAEQSNGKFEVIFIFTPKKNDWHNVYISLRTHKLNYPVILDKESDFINLNPALPKDKRLHTFLLDRNNKIVLLGSPVRNDGLWELQKEEIERIVEN